MKTHWGGSFHLFLFLTAIAWLLFSGGADASARELDFNQSGVVEITDSEAYPVTGSYTWIRYKAPRNGYIKLQAFYGSKKYTYSLGYWRLYQANKKTALSADKVSYTTKNGTDSYARTSYFGVKKGKTYYLRVLAYDGVRLQLDFRAVREQSAAIRKKAKLLRKAKTVTGTVLSRDKASDWYKLRLSRAQNIQICYRVRSDGKFRLSLYSGDGSELTSLVCGYTPKTQRAVVRQKSGFTGSYAKMAAGTYYLRVEPETSYSSGYYTLKWK